MEDSIGENLDVLVYGNAFLDITARAQSMKKIVKLDFIKIKRLLLCK